jgi:hypothetical protein
MARVFARQTGNGVAPDVSRRRIRENDGPNFQAVAATRGAADIVVPHLPLKPMQQGG